jgi:gliding motility-associated lipoprotein GldD
MLKTKIINYLFLSSILFFVGACGNTYSPKPHAYFRIDFPEKEYQQYLSECPYTFSYPVYADIVYNNKESCWIDVNYTEFNANIHITYRKIGNNIVENLEDARTLAYKHTVKADAIDEKLFNNFEAKVHGVLYDIKGNAASSVQFFVTDSVNNFLRGALYFNVNPNKDSLAPVVEFIKQDIIHLIETFEWKE